MLQNLLSAGNHSLQAACTAGSRLRSPQPATLEVSEILGPQIKAKGSILLGRREKIVFCVVDGKKKKKDLKTSELADAGLEFLYYKAADRCNTRSIVQPEGGFSISHQSKAKLYQTGPVSKKCQGAR